MELINEVVIPRHFQTEVPWIDARHPEPQRQKRRRPTWHILQPRLYLLMIVGHDYALRSIDTTGQYSFGRALADFAATMIT